MKVFLGLFLGLLLISVSSSSFAWTRYKNTDGYNYLKDKEAQAIEYRKNLPVEEKIDISNDITQINQERAKIRKKYHEVYELKLTSKRYINRQKDEFDTFEEDITSVETKDKIKQDKSL